MENDEDELADVCDIPSQKYMCIEYPGYVKSIEKVMEMFGGIGNINQVYQERQKQLSIFLRPQDQFSHPIFCDGVQTASLLLSVTKKDETLIEGELIGTIPFTYRCEGLADFQYFPENVVNSDFKILNSIFDDETKINDIPPPIFSKSDNPYSYKLWTNASYRNQSNLTLHKDNSIMNLDNLSIISFDSPHLPQSPPKPTSIVRKSLVNLLRVMFDDRPIWSKTSIQCVVPQHPAATMSAYLTHSTMGPGEVYTLDLDTIQEGIQRTGDFRCPEEMTRGKILNNWLRYPTEKPRRVTSTRLLDKLDEKNLQSNKQKALYKTIRELEYKFLKPPGHRQTLYMLVDLEIPGIDDLISSEPSVECKQETGWIKHHILKKIRTLMSERLPYLIKLWDDKQILDVNQVGDDELNSLSIATEEEELDNLSDFQSSRTTFETLAELETVPDKNQSKISSFLENVFNATANISDDMDTYEVLSREFSDGNEEDEEDNYDIYSDKNSQEDSQEY